MKGGGNNESVSYWLHCHLLPRLSHARSDLRNANMNANEIVALAAIGAGALLVCAVAWVAVVFEGLEDKMKW